MRQTRRGARGARAVGPTHARPLEPMLVVARLQSAIGNRAAHRLLAGDEQAADRAATRGLAGPVPSTQGPPSQMAGGSPLPDRVRAEMEARFGVDFHAVRIHSGGQAADSASAIGAEAFTVSNDIVFREGRYAPSSTEGHTLLAHELAHVVQQRANGPAVQCKPTTVDTTEAVVPFDLGPLHIDIKTHEQLLAASRFVVEQLRQDLADPHVSDKARESAAAWIRKVEDWQPYLASQGTAPLGPATVKIAREWLGEVGAIGKGIHREKSEAEEARVTALLKQARAQAEAAATELERLQPALANELHHAYLKEKPEHIREAAEMAGTALGVGKDMHELAEKITHALAAGEEAAEHGVMEAEHAGKLLEGTLLLAKGLAAINAAFAIADTEKRGTASEQGMHDLERSVAVFGSLTVILDMDAHIGLYTHLYLEPMIKIIAKLMTKLIDQLHEQNIDWVALTGEPLYTGAEEGGEAMFPFMRRVMRAKSAEQIPEVPEELAKYFVEHRERLDEGTFEEMPTKGMWFWRSMDRRKTKEWLFQNRSRIWAMLFGSMGWERE